MKPIKLRFDAPVRPSLRWLNGVAGGIVGWSGVAAMICASSLLAYVGWLSTQAAQQLSATQSRVDELQQTSNLNRSATRTALSLSPEQRDTWNQITRQLNTPWASLLDALESATPEGIALVSIEPDVRHNSIRLQAEAKTLDALLQYAQALKAVDLFDDVTPIKHEVNEQDANRPFRLSLNIRLQASEAHAPTTRDD